MGQTMPEDNIPPGKQIYDLMAELGAQNSRVDELERENADLRAALQPFTRVPLSGTEAFVPVAAMRRAKELMERIAQ